MAEKWFLELDGIPGGSTDPQHLHQIEVEAWSWGLANASAHGSGGGGGAGKASFDDVQIVAPLSVASPGLFLACAAGSHIAHAVLWGVRSGPVPVDLLELTLRDLLVSAYHVGDDTLAAPTDRFSLVFGRLELRYTPQDAAGRAGVPVTAGWDVKQNKTI
jgi:type VI secretion system secreted protein Hcp